MTLGFRPFCSADEEMKAVELIGTIDRGERWIFEGAGGSADLAGFLERLCHLSKDAFGVFSACVYAGKLRFQIGFDTDTIDYDRRKKCQLLPGHVPFLPQSAATLAKNAMVATDASLFCHNRPRRVHQSIRPDGWIRCREGKEDPNKFGIFNMCGLWFVRGDLIRELAARNDAEMLPWDVWGLVAGDDKSLTEEQYALLDKVARALVADDEEEIMRLYNSEPGLKVPAEMLVAGV